MSNLGELIETPDVIVFFGNKNSSLEKLKTKFPNLEFRKLKQTHSDVLVESHQQLEDQSTNLVQADAHFVQEKEVALLISTADCLPVLVWVPNSKLVLAIHAGWRGIESNIIGKSILQLKQRGHDVSDARVWIGPHIGFQSFEVSLDVADRLRTTYKALPTVVYGEFEQPQPDPLKKRINLFLIAVLQLVSAGIHEQNISSLMIDTVESDEHESYRRDGAKAGRQFSFIALK